MRELALLRRELPSGIGMCRRFNPQNPGHRLIDVPYAGAPVPPGADAVIQVEDTEKLPPGPDGKPRVKILKASKPDLDIRQIGSDIK